MMPERSNVFYPIEACPRARAALPPHATVHEFLARLGDAGERRRLVRLLWPQAASAAAARARELKPPPNDHEIGGVG